MKNLGGYVTSYKIFRGKNNQIDEDGLLSQKIFGPINSYKCICGNLCIMDKGTTCHKCGVFCGSNDLRVKTFGKIKLVFPIIHLNKINNLKKIFKSSNKFLSQIIDPIFSDSNLSSEYYIGITGDGEEVKIVDDLKINKPNFYIVPLRITGIYSFILCLRYLTANFANDVKIVGEIKKLFDNGTISDEIKVLPPEVRPVILDPKKKNTFRVHEVNKHYVSLLRLNKANDIYKSNIVIDEENWLKMVDVNFRKMIKEPIVDLGIMEYDTTTAKYQFYANLVYNCVYEMISKKEGFIRSLILSKTIEFSARTVIRVNPAVKPYQISVSRYILFNLWKLHFIHYLTNVQQFEYDYCLENIVLKEYYEIKDLFDEFLDWFLSNEEFNRKRLILFNRQPTLWSHGIAGVEVVPSEKDVEDKTIGVNPLIIAPFNADFDGDTMALYGIHSEEALEELEQKMFIKNRIHYEQNKNFLSTVRHEALYIAYILSLNQDEINKDNIFLTVNRIQDLPESINYFNNNLYDTVYIKYSKKYTTYGNCLLNKWCGFDHLILEKLIDKKQANEISRWIYRNQDRNKENFYNQLNELEQKLFLFSTITNHNPSISIKDMTDLLDENSEKLFKKIPDLNVHIGYILNKSLVERCIEQLDHNCTLYKLFKSGSRFSQIQLSRSCINIGYVSNDKNIIIREPINSNLLKGLSEKDFFKGSSGTLKSIKDKSIQTPQSGYLERTIVMGLSILEITEDDCMTDDGIETIVFSKNHAKTLSDKYFKDPEKLEDWKLLDYRTALKYINKKIIIRSPMTCKTKHNRMCRKCFGERKFNTKYLGIVAGTNLAERLTQLILRTFHTSASAEIDVDRKLIDFFKYNLVDINSKNSKLYIDYRNQIDNDVCILLEKIKGFDHIDNQNNLIVFNEIREPTNNKDVVQLLGKIKDVLKKTNHVTKTPHEYYSDFMSMMLSVGIIYSSFIEMLFANLFLVDEENRIFWRYNTEKPISVKLSDKGLPKYISNLLGLLYEPNKKSIEKINESLDELLEKPEKHTIYEKIWFKNL